MWLPLSNSVVNSGINSGTSVSLPDEVDAVGVKEVEGGLVSAAKV